MNSQPQFLAANSKQKTYIVVYVRIFRGVYYPEKVKIEFSVVSDKGGVSYQMLVTESKNIVSSRSYWILKS